MAKLLISDQKYLELLERQSVNAALHILRTELAPLTDDVDVDQLHSLSAYAFFKLFVFALPDSEFC